MTELTPCPECQRHIRKSETSCPFCAATVSLAHLPPHALPRNRLGRAATFAFGASVVGVTALVSCSSDSDGGSAVYGAPPSGGSASTGGSFGGSAVYGAPPSGSSNGGSSVIVAGGAAVYGAPAAGTGNQEPGAAGAAGAGGNAAGGAGGTNDDISGAGGEGLVIYGGPPAGAGGN